MVRRNLAMIPTKTRATHQEANVTIGAVNDISPQMGHHSGDSVLNASVRPTPKSKAFDAMNPSRMTQAITLLVIAVHVKNRCPLPAPGATGLCVDRGSMLSSRFCKSSDSSCAD